MWEFSKPAFKQLETQELSGFESSFNTSFDTAFNTAFSTPFLLAFSDPLVCVLHNGLSRFGTDLLDGSIIYDVFR